MNKRFIGLAILISILASIYVIFNNKPKTETAMPTATQEKVSNSPLSAPCGYTTTIGQGPYYVSGAPKLLDGNLNYTNQPGDKLVLTGYVYEGTENPSPIPNAELDFWQTDANGD